MVEPTGWFRLFWRDEKDPSVLHGQQRLESPRSKETPSRRSATCGSKIVFNAGKITQLQLKDRTFEYQYSASRVSEIREGGRTVLKVDSDPYFRNCERIKLRRAGFRLSLETSRRCSQSMGKML